MLRINLRWKKIVSIGCIVISGGIFYRWSSIYLSGIPPFIGWWAFVCVNSLVPSETGDFCEPSAADLALVGLFPRVGTDVFDQNVLDRKSGKKKFLIKIPLWSKLSSF